MTSTDTIAAIATAPGRGGIGIVRLSGKDLTPYLNGLVGREIPPRQAVFTVFRDAAGEPLDEGIALYFPAPHSYTGENILELQGHGGPAVLNLVLQRAIELGARLAQPGEFTRRAYLNDKLDLAQAEAVVDLIDAATGQAARSALRSLQGAFSQQVEALVAALVNLRMLVEATLDFPDEEIDFLEAAHARDKLAAIQAQLAQVLATSRQGLLLREGLQVVLIGPPNVGKSSLLNQLAGEEVAIVTPVAGTTRDAIRQVIDLNGVALHIIDTAGLRETEDVVEQIGIARTRAEIDRANLALMLVDAGAGETAESMAIVRSLPAALPVWRVLNKIDLPADARAVDPGQYDLAISARTGENMAVLRQRLLAFAGRTETGEGVFMARQRHIQALEAAAACLARAMEQYQSSELLAEELRLAQQSLNEITGEFTADDLLGEIFSRFCIGK